MSDFPEAGIRLVAEVDDFRSEMDSLVSDYDDKELTLSASVEVDDSGISDLLSLEDTDIAPTVTPEYDDENILPFEDLEDAEVTPTVDPEMSKDGQGIMDKLDAIRKLQVIQIAINIAGTVLDFINAWENFTVQPLLDADQGMAKFGAQTGVTGDALQAVGDTIKQIFFDDLGTSVDQVTAVATAAQQIGAPIDEAARAALTFTHTFSDQDPVTVLNTLNSLVINDLAPNFTEASDLLVVGFQNGANRAGDLVAALNQNATAFHDMGFTGQEALSLITTGLDSGFTSATQVAQTVEKIKTNLTAAAGNGSSPITGLLESIGVENPVEAGGEWSAQAIQAVIDGIKNADVSDTEKMSMLQTLVGGKLSTKEASAILGLDAFSGAFDDVTGAASDAASQIDDSLSGALDDFKLAAQEAATNFLSSDAIDLPGKIAALKTGLQDALNVLSNDGTLGEALTVALKPIGFDDEFQSLESALGNFIIGILQAVASIQDLTGHGEEAKGTRATIAGMGKDQLAFDLQLDNPDEIATDIATAVSRGVTPTQIAESAATAVSELVKNGATAQAQALLDQFATAKPNLQVAQGLNGEDITKANAALRNGGDQLQQALDAGIVVNVTPTISPDEIATLQKQIDDAKLQVGLGGGKQVNPTGDLQTNGATTTDTTGHTLGLSASVSDLTTKADAATAAQDALNSKVDTLGAKATAAQTPVDTLATAADTVGTSAVAAYDPLTSLVVPIDAIADSADTATISVQNVSDALPPMTTNLQAVPGALQNISDAAAALAAQGGSATITPVDNGTTTTDGPFASGTGSATGTFMVGEEGPEIVTSNRALAVLNNKSTSAIMRALHSGGAMMSGMGAGGNIYNVNQSVNVQSQAQADALGYATGRLIRGMA